MVGGAVDSQRLTILGIGGVGVLILLWCARNAAGAGLASVPKYESEAQFDGLDVDVAGRVNAGTMLDVSHDIHGFVPGYCCPGQSIGLTQHRYPTVSGGNLTAVMNHGMSRLCEGSPDNDWRVQPPSEVTI